MKITPDLSARSNGAFTRIFRVRQVVRNGCSVLFNPIVNSLSLLDGTVISLVIDNGLHWLEFDFPADVAETPVGLLAMLHPMSLFIVDYVTLVMMEFVAFML